MEPKVATTLIPALRRFCGAPVADDTIELGLTEIERELEEIAEERGEPALGLTLPERLVFSRYELFELAARASSDVRAALHRLAPHLHARVPGVTASFGDRAFRARFPARARKPSRVLHEFALAHPLHAVRAESGEFLLPTRVWFVHARPRDLGPVHAFFGTRELEFGAEDDGFELPEETLDRPLRGHDPRLLATMDSLVRPEEPARSWADRVERAIALPDVTLESAARALHASPRTVQRRLEEEGTSFSEVLDRARAALARRLLRETDRKLADVASAVGYSDLAPFSRAFRKWTGTPPGAFRGQRYAMNKVETK